MTERFDELDISRGLAILAVILIHISSNVLSINQNNIEEIVSLFINQLMRFAVPALLLLSGWGLTITKKYNQNYISFLKNQLSKILLFYMIWNIIYYAVNVDSFSIIGFIKSIVFGSSMYQLYYVPVIIFFYLIYPLLFKVTKSNFGLLSILIITVVSQLGDYITGISVLNSPLNVFNWIFFFALGIWLANNFKLKALKLKEYKSMIISLYIVTSLVVCIEAYFNLDLGQSLATTSMRPSVILLSIAFIMFSISLNWIDNWVKKINLKLANASYCIYLSHPIVLITFERIWLKLGFTINSVYYIILAFFIVTIISYIISILMDKIELIIKSFFKKQKVAME